MGLNAVSGPNVSYGIAQTSTGGTNEYNTQRAPNLWDLGDGLYDPRAANSYRPGSAVSGKIFGFFNNLGIVDQIPGTISTNCIAAAQVPTAGSALTLRSANSGPVTVGSSQLIDPATGQLVSNSATILVVDGYAGGLAFGTDGTVNIWDPTHAVSRCVTVSARGSSVNLDDSGGYWAVVGRDVYGYPMTENITCSTNLSSNADSTVTSKKAFKYITSVTPTNSTGTMVSTNAIVGVADTYGFPIRADNAGYITLRLGSTTTMATIVELSSNAVFASTATATSTTGDVRGTYASTTASSTTSGIRINIQVAPSVQNLNTVTASDTSGLFGVTQA